MGVSEEQQAKNHIQSLKEVLAELAEAEDIPSWSEKCLMRLRRIFPEDHEGVKRIRQIGDESSLTKAFGKDMDVFGRTDESRRSQAQTVLKECILSLEQDGLPKDSPLFSLTVMQNQSQTVSISIVMEALSNELSEAQLKEIRDLLNQGNSTEEKKQNLTTKLLSFGADVAANVVANLLTRPIA